MPKRKKKLKNELLYLPNADKAFHEKWHKGRNMLNIPHPFRSVCLGPPNSGKSNVVTNLIMRQDPPFEEIKVIHCDAEFTKEYDWLGEDGVEIMAEVPAPTEFEGLVKTLVILDDLEFKTMNKTQKYNLDRLFGFVSTHKNISVILCSQDPFNVPPIVRRCANLFVLWKSPDLESMAICARKTGLKSSAFNELFGHILTEPRDSLWIDMTSKSPYQMRKNGFELIQEEKIYTDKNSKGVHLQKHPNDNE